MNAKAVSVLLVEDNDFDVMRVTRAFKTLGDHRSVIRARDGLEALEIIKGDAAVGVVRRPFVVVLDLNMPRMGGLELLDEIRRDEKHRNTPVFVVTTSDYHADVAAAYDRMVNGYFVKPRTAREMTDILKLLSEYWDKCAYPH